MYRIHRSTNPHFDDYYDDIGDLFGNTTFEDDNLDADTIYYYDVWAFFNDDSAIKVGDAVVHTPALTQSKPVTGP